MKIVITSFNNVRYFTPNMIPISTAGRTGWPYWMYKYDHRKIGTKYFNKHKVIIGLVAKDLAFSSDLFEELGEKCQKDCPYADKAPNCQFMQEYYKYLKTKDFNKLMSDFEIAAKKIKEWNHYEGEPIIVLLVYEAASKLCGERYGLIKWFADNGYKLEEWTKQSADKETLF